MIPTSRRLSSVGSLPLDQLQLPQTEADEEVYLVRQFHTTSKGFVNRGSVQTNFNPLTE